MRVPQSMLWRGHMCVITFYATPEFRSSSGWNVTFYCGSTVGRRTGILGYLGQLWCYTNLWNQFCVPYMRVITLLPECLYMCGYIVCSILKIFALLLSVKGYRNTVAAYSAGLDALCLLSCIETSLHIWEEVCCQRSVMLCEQIWQLRWFYACFVSAGQLRFVR